MGKKKGHGRHGVETASPSPARSCWVRSTSSRRNSASRASAATRCATSMSSSTRSPIPCRPWSRRSTGYARRAAPDGGRSRSRRRLASGGRDHRAGSRPRRRGSSAEAERCRGRAATVGPREHGGRARVPRQGAGVPPEPRRPGPRSCRDRQGDGRRRRGSRRRLRRQPRPRPPRSRPTSAARGKAEPAARPWSVPVGAPAPEATRVSGAGRGRAPTRPRAAAGVAEPEPAVSDERRLPRDGDPPCATCSRARLRLDAEVDVFGRPRRSATGRRALRFGVIAA